MNRKRIIELNGMPLKMTEHDHTYRDILSPMEASMIDSGEYELVDGDEHPVNIDAPLRAPAGGKKGIASSEYRLKCQKRRMPPNWVGNYPGAENMSFLFLIMSEESVSSSKEYVEYMRSGGFFTAGFTSPDSLNHFIRRGCEEKSGILNEIDRIAIVADYEGLESIHEAGAIGGEQADASPPKQIIGCSFGATTGTSQREQKFFENMFPASILLSSDMLTNTQRIVSSLNFDWQVCRSYYQCPSSSNSFSFLTNEGKRAAQESQRILQEILSLAGNNYVAFSNGVEEFQRRSCEYSSLSIEHLTAILVGIPDLNPLSTRIPTQLGGCRGSCHAVLKKTFDRWGYCYA